MKIFIVDKGSKKVKGEISAYFAKSTDPGIGNYN